MSKDMEFEKAMQEFISEGGVVEVLPYQGPGFVERDIRTTSDISIRNEPKE